NQPCRITLASAPSRFKPLASHGAPHHGPQPSSACWLALSLAESEPVGGPSPGSTASGTSGTASRERPRTPASSAAPDSPPARISGTKAGNAHSAQAAPTGAGQASTWARAAGAAARASTVTLARSDSRRRIGALLDPAAQPTPARVAVSSLEIR